MTIIHQYLPPLPMFRCRFCSLFFLVNIAHKIEYFINILDVYLYEDRHEKLMKRGSESKKHKRQTDEWRDRVINRCAEQRAFQIVFLIGPEEELFIPDRRGQNNSVWTKNQVWIGDGITKTQSATVVGKRINMSASCHIDIFSNSFWVWRPLFPV